MVDLDFLALEYDQGKAVAIVEFKNEHAQPQYASHPSYQAIIDLGNKASVPVFAVRYADDFVWWRVTPLNQCAKDALAERAEMSEKEWVTFLYRLRGREMSQGLIEDGEIEL